MFTHGQLYVTSSRTGDPDALKFAVMQQPGEPLFAIANVVFKEVLLIDSLTETQFDVIFGDTTEHDEAPARQSGQATLKNISRPQMNSNKLRMNG